MSEQESPFELLVRIAAEKQGITLLEAAAQLTVMSVNIGAAEDAKRFAEIMHQRRRAGDRPAEAKHASHDHVEHER